MESDCNFNGVYEANSTKCLCNRNYYGSKCEYTLCSPNDLEYNQCRHSGVCIKHFQTNETKCKCNSSYGVYTGGLCEIPLCLNYCYNDGRCSVVNNKMTCSCESARFTGDRCQFDKCFEKKCPKNCFMNSSCDCVCGNDCNYQDCSKSNGTCYENHGQLACECRSGFSGAICSVDECKGYCFNGGTCVRNKASISCK